MKALLTLIAATCTFGLLLTFVTAADNAPTTQQSTITGILIDQACGAKFMKKDNPEKAAESHPKSCAQGCAKSGYAVISGKEMIKFDDNGNKLAKDFLDKTDKTDDLRVTVVGARSGDKIEVASLTAAPDEKK